MSAHSDATIAGFLGLLALAGEQVLINSVTYTAQVSALTENEIIVLGGKAESGGFNVKCKLSDFPVSPAQWTPITAKGKDLLIESDIRNNGHIAFFAIDPARDD